MKTWLADRKRRRMVAELESCYEACRVLAARSHELNAAISRHDEAHPGGATRYAATVRARPARETVYGEPVRVARTMQEAFGPGATLEAVSAAARKRDVRVNRGRRLVRLVWVLAGVTYLTIFLIWRYTP